MKPNYSNEFIVSLYDQNDIETMKNVEIINSEYGNRIESISRFAELSGYKKIGIAHCISYTQEARHLANILKSKFKVVSVDCKVGHIQRGVLLKEGSGSACNPVLQATYLNQEETDLNIVLGLCLGHDILFTKYSKAPSSTLYVKD
jgi:uncharacterized metal-binding protein